MSLSEDPWERREAERRRFRERSGRRRRRGSDPTGPLDASGPPVRALAVLAAILLLLLADLPVLPPVAQTVFATLGGGGILVLLMAWRDYAEGIVAAAFRPTNVALAALLLWSVFCAFQSPYPVQASAEILRLFGGAGVFWYGAYALRAPRERSSAAAGLLALAAVMAMADFLHFGQNAPTAGSVAFQASAVTLFGTHESVGTLLGVLLPLAAAFAFVPDVPDRSRLAAQVATLILGFAWMMARCRSAWVGGGLALLLLAALLWRLSRTSGERRGGARGRLAQILESPLPVIVGAILVLAVVGGVGPLLIARLEGVGRALDGGSLVARWDMWRGAMQMLAERPFAGFGLGGYLVLQGDWTHHGDVSWDVLRAGTNLVNLAHNYYLQWAADTGLVGLGLLTAFLTAMLHAMLSAIRAARGVARALVLAGVAGCVSLVVTALGSPSFHLHGIWAAAMLVLGLGFGAARDAVPGDRSSTRRGVAVAVAAAIVGTLVGGGLALAGRPSANAGPRGVWQVRVDAPGGFRAGQVLTWKASFTDARGVAQSTFPGTFWEAPVLIRRGKADGAVLDARPVEPERSEVLGRRKTYAYADSELKVRLPEDVASGEHWEIWVSASYRDTAGRRYRATSVVPVEP